ncbi:serine/threonine-protein kinase [Breoghania sp.]|uniref:serine/threonine protein kinase n=1 Tax=Breoghania sp. TaxID=2065378 RepID=UPI002628E21D|nr:serine/threonine-protein kinase [Breoghania sp.]MDJ0930647.1 serine/threonine-protein kinase [Breoghania sp.]
MISYRATERPWVPTGSDTKVDYDWAVDKFIAEATTLAKFRHLGIVQVLQILKGENNSAYMVLEYVDGQSLDQWLKSLPTVPSQVQLETAIAPMLDALAAVHKADFTHRDIAPDNIFIRKNGEAVLLDFGAAKLTAAQHSKTMHQIVKNGYSAPEQYYEEGRQGPWTDIYAFSTTLYQCLFGKKPIDAMARLDALHNEEPDPLPPLEALGLEGYDPAFLAAISRGLSPQAKNHPQDVETWRAELLGTQAGEPQSAPPGQVSTEPRSTPQKATSPQPNTGTEPTPQTGNRYRLVAAAAVLAVLVAAEAAAVSGSTDSNRHRRKTPPGRPPPILIRAVPTRRSPTLFPGANIQATPRLPPEQTFRPVGDHAGQGPWTRGRNDG